jgi:hypothetical protein
MPQVFAPPPRRSLDVAGTAVALYSMSSGDIFDEPDGLAQMMDSSRLQATKSNSQT